MPISPLAPGAFRSSNAANLLTNTRLSLDDLQRQLATGKKSQTFGGLGTQRITSLNLRAKLSEVEGYQSTITTFQFRAKQLDLNLNQLGKIGDDVRSFTFLPQYNPDSTGKTSIQNYVKDRFNEAIDGLNLQVNGTYFFSGRSTDVRPVLDGATILNGDAAGRAGVTQLVTERKAADYGVLASAGRVTRGGAGTNATLTEDGTHPFGFKLTAASSTAPGITSALTVGPPADITFNVAANPLDGQQVRFELTLPDGTKQSVARQARVNSKSAPHQLLRLALSELHSVWHLTARPRRPCLLLRPKLLRMRSLQAPSTVRRCVCQARLRLRRRLLRVPPPIP
jgi:flagellar hook-associated protein 3 FlgL